MNHRSHTRSIALAIMLRLLTAMSTAAAQAPAGDGADAARAEAVLPLVISAESDALAGRHSLAIARAAVVLDAEAPTALRLRAQSVALVARESLAGAAPAEQSIELVLEPLVRAAEREMLRGREGVARAHLEIVLARAPADGVLATQSRSLLARLAPASAPAAGAEAPVIVVPRTEGASVRSEPAASALSTSSGPATPQAAEPADAGPAVPAPDDFEDPEPAPAAPLDPTRRGDGEVVELMVTAGLFGAYVGFWIPFASGLEGGSGRAAGPANTAYSLSILAGGALFALGALGLDAGDGFRTGVAPSMSIGLRLGTLSGFLLWGAADPLLSPTAQCSGAGGSSCAEIRGGWSERTAFPFAMGLGGLLTGAVVGYGLRPTTEQVRFVELQGTLWGVSIGAMLGAAAQQGTRDDGPIALALTAGGLGAGVLTTALMSGLGVRMSQSRAWLMTLGIVVGGAAAALVSTIVNGVTNEWAAWPITFGGIGAAASLTGLVVAGFLTEGMDAPRADPARPSVDVRPTLTPLEGGGMAGLHGTF